MDHMEQRVEDLGIKLTVKMKEFYDHVESTRLSLNNDHFILEQRVSHVEKFQDQIDLAKNSVRSL